MTTDTDPIIIKKYANRRLYNTDTAAFVTLDDLHEMVKDATPFVVRDVKTDADITCSILAQIVAEEENRGNNMLPLGYLRHILKLYSDGVGPQLSGYLEQSMDGFIANQQQMMKQVTDLMGGGTSPDAWMEMSRKNMEIFQDSMNMFQNGGETNGADPDGATDQPEQPSKPVGREAEIDALKNELAAIQARLNDLAK